MRTLSFVFICMILCFVFQANAQDFTEHTLATGYNSWSAVAVDMDGDGDIDIAGSSRLTNRISWWENDGEENFTLRQISANAAYVMGICAADLDSDGDIDVVAAVQEADAIIWWENNGEEGFTQHLLADILSPSYIDTCDLDQDNDIDLVVAACEDGSDKIVWCENMGNFSFTTHIIKENWDHANSIHPADMDLDGDMDVLATASFRTHPTANGEIAWFENDGNQNFTEHTIISDYGRPGCAIAVDIDNDQDMDVIATVCLLNRLVLFKNNGNMAFTPFTIANDFIRPHCVYTADLDNDSDPDILATSIDLNQIAWWENDTSGLIKHSITNSFTGATCVSAGDIDGDGDADILGTAQYENQIAWWENSLIIGFDEKENDRGNPVFLYQNYPNPFLAKTTIPYEIKSPGEITVRVYNAFGSEVACMGNQSVGAGKHTVEFDGRSMPGGLYYYRICIDGLAGGCGKMMLIP